MNGAVGPPASRPATAWRLLLIVGAVAGLAFFNVWLAAAIAAGVAAGELARWLIRRLPRPRMRTVLIAVVALIAALVLALFLLAIIFVDFGAGVGGPAPSTWTLPYQVQARYEDGRFVVRDQLQMSHAQAVQIARAMPTFRSTYTDTVIQDEREMGRSIKDLLRMRTGRSWVAALVHAGVSPQALIAAGADPATVRPAAARFGPDVLERAVLQAFAGQGWVHARTLNGRFVLRRRSPRVVDGPVRLWPLTTSISVPTSTIRLADVVLVAPDEQSTVDVIAKSNLIVGTAPPSSVEGIGVGLERRRVVIGSASDPFSDEAPVIRIEAASPLARNPVVARVRDWTVWTPILFLTTIVTAIFSDAVKNLIKRSLRPPRTKEQPLPAGESA